MKHTRLPLVVALLACSASASFAQNTREDYDLDNDGLIEINSLADLDLIRYSATGASLNGQSAGCPEAGCVGFELTADIDFDTNRDGRFGPGDSHWNQGTGWVPIPAFSGRFNGNDFVIRNLYVNHSGGNPHVNAPAAVGLFAHTDGAIIENLGLVTARQPHGVAQPYAISGRDAAGALIGRAVNTQLRAIWAQVSVEGRSAGGLVGAGEITAQAIHVSGRVDATAPHEWTTPGVCAGGLVGMSEATTAEQLVIQVERRALDCDGPVVGTLMGANITAPFAISQVLERVGDVIPSAGADFATAASQASPYYWQLGSAEIAPALVVNGNIWRDSDGDGHFDYRDQFPLNPAAFADSDGDGAIDAWAPGCDSDCQSASVLVLDQFPHNPAASVDADLDGLPDRWNPQCNTACRTASGLTLDTHLNDSDNDGVKDNAVAQAVRDTYADKDGNGLIEILSLQDLHNIRYSLAGFGRASAANGTLDTSGCPIRVVGGTLARACHGYELMRSIDFTQAPAVEWADTGYHLPVWRPLARFHQPFRAEFNGNGWSLSKVFTYTRDSDEFAGLFGVLRDASIRNLIIDKSEALSLLAGPGLLAGKASYTTLDNIAVEGYVHGPAYGDKGLLVGSLERSRVSGAVVSGLLEGDGYSQGVGALAGRALDSHIERVRTSVEFTQARAAGGVLGLRQNTSLSQVLAISHGQTWSGNLHPLAVTTQGAANVNDSVYWADTSLNPVAASGYTLAQLRCPAAPADANCAPNDLYENFVTAATTSDDTYWLFGQGNALPALVLNGNVFADSDGDGVFDESDAFPLDFAASLDTDQDGAPDRWNANCNIACQTASGLVLDQFPTNSAAIVDLDLDGLPDAWREGCDLVCRTSSDLTLDMMLNDHDNDGIPDAQAPAGGVDRDGDGLIEIDSLAQLYQMRFELAGLGRRTALGGELDTTGCPVRVVDGVLKRACHGYELTTHLDFDSNGDGKVDATDAFWINDFGWYPVGTGVAGVNPFGDFKAVFNGNGFSIRNLHIRGAGGGASLFGNLFNAHIKDLHITLAAGERDEGFAGVLASSVNHSLIEGVTVEVRFKGRTSFGGLVGAANNSTFNAVAARGSITNRALYQTPVGGLIASTTGRVAIKGAIVEVDVFAHNPSTHAGGLVGAVTGDLVIDEVLVISESASGGLIGRVAGGASVNSTTPVYWSATGARVPNAISENLGQGFVSAQRLTQSALKCLGTVSANCLTAPSSAGWSVTQAASNYPWHFGNDSQLPGLTLASGVYRAQGTVNPWLDTDADGVADQHDDFPTNAAASLDSDDDGAPDRWNAGCAASCQSGSSLVLDAFPLTAAASVDSNGDGVPDAWHPGCDSACQLSSGYWTQWNQIKPVITQVPGALRVAADAMSGTTQVTLAPDQVVAYDELNSREGLTLAPTGFSLDANNAIQLAPGKHLLAWVATDRAGRVSEPMQQVVEVYPQVGFEETELRTGFASTVTLPIIIGGTLPQYPASITVTLDNALDSLPEGLIEGLAQSTRFTVGELNDASQQELTFTINQPLAALNELVLNFTITHAATEGAEPFTLSINEARAKAQVTITEENIAPVVAIDIEQDGASTGALFADRGDATVSVQITDVNGFDTHQTRWNLSALGLAEVVGPSWTLLASQMQSGRYDISASVTDSGTPALTTEVAMTLEIFAQLPYSSSAGMSSFASSSEPSSHSTSSVATSSAVNSGSSVSSALASSVSSAPSVSSSLNSSAVTVSSVSSGVVSSISSVPSSAQTVSSLPSTGGVDTGSTSSSSALSSISVPSGSVVSSSSAPSSASASSALSSGSAVSSSAYSSASVASSVASSQATSQALSSSAASVSSAKKSGGGAFGGAMLIMLGLFACLRRKSSKGSV